MLNMYTGAQIRGLSGKNPATGCEKRAFAAGSLLRTASCTGCFLLCGRFRFPPLRNSDAETLREKTLRALSSDTFGESVLALQVQRVFSSCQYLFALCLTLGVANTVFTTKRGYKCFNFHGENNILEAVHLLILRILIHDGTEAVS